MCEGYESPFGNYTTGDIRPISSHITIRDIQTLSYHFSTKTSYGTTLGCEEEAKHILHAGLFQPAIQYAISALQALRAGGQDTNGVQQYNMALRDLASTLSSSSTHRLQSALLCCQLFITIEQTRGNYLAMAQHITQGLKIMHEHRVRPMLSSSLLPAHRDLPLLDAFIIKLFIAPCKLAKPPQVMSSVCQHENPRTIAPDMRAEVKSIAARTLTFLDRATQVKSLDQARNLIPIKKDLLSSLDPWLLRLETTKANEGAPMYLTLMCLFHHILKIIVLGAVDTSTAHAIQLSIEYSRLQDVAKEMMPQWNAPLA